MKNTAFLTGILGKRTKLRSASKRNHMTFARRQNRYGYLFMIPWMIGFVLFTAIPFIATIYFSFTEVKQTVKGFEIKFIGWNNYSTAFFENVEFVPAMLSFIGMVIPYTFVILIVSFLLSYLLNKITYLKGFLRTIYFLPVIIMSGPVMYQLMNTGGIGGNREMLGALSDIFIIKMLESYSPLLANAFVNVFRGLSTILWFTGIPIILFINGLQKINPSLYEAAQIDSANAWQILWKITIPIIKPISLVVTIFTIAQLGTFETNPVYDLIKTATANTSGGLGIASTFAWIYSFVVLIIIGIAFIIFRSSKKVRK